MATEAEVAEHLDLSDRSVRELKSKRVFHSVGRGGYDLADCRTAYIRQLREKAAGRGADAGSRTLSDERARFAKEQADRVALQNALARNELASLPDMTLAVLTVIELVKARLLRLPAIVAKNDAKLRERIDVALADALEELSLTRVEEIGGGSHGEDAGEDANPDED